MEESHGNILRFEKEFENKVMEKNMIEYDSVDEFFNHQIYRWNKIFFLMIGRWPYQNLKWRVIILFTVISEFTLILLGQVFNLVEVFGDIGRMIDSLYELTVAYCVYVIVINSAVQFDLMKEILRTMKNNWTQLENEDENAIFQSHAQAGRASILIYLGIFVTGMSVRFLQPLVPKLSYLLINGTTNGSDPLVPLTDVQFYIDESEHQTPLYLLSVMAAFYKVFIIFTFDAYFIMNVYHACGMYVALGNRIDMISQDYANYSSFTRNNREEFIFRKIVECIKYHQDCIRFSELVEAFSNVTWMMQITALAIAISLKVVQAMLQTNGSEEAYVYGSSAVCTVARLFYISHAGQKILNASVQIRESIYNISWYKLPPKAKKLLMPMLLRASRPSNITIGKLMPLNLHTFCSFLNVSMSYITFFLSAR